MLRNKAITPILIYTVSILALLIFSQTYIFNRNITKEIII